MLTGSLAPLNAILVSFILAELRNKLLLLPTLATVANMGVFTVLWALF